MATHQNLQTWQQPCPQRWWQVGRLNRSRGPCRNSAATGLLLAFNGLSDQLLAAQDAQLAIDPHGDAGAALAGDLAGPLAGAHQGSGHPAEVGVIELALEAAGQG